MDNGNGHQTNDEYHPPRLFPSRGGTRMVSMAALIERVVFAFSQEHADNSVALIEATTKAEYLKLIRDTVNYVVSVESVILTTEELAEVIRQAYAELFAYGPLDPLFEDDSVTTIALDGIEKVSVRREHGELEETDALFEDVDHFTGVVKRLLRNAGAELRPDQPYIEAGLVIDGRRVCVNLVGPPVSYQIKLDVRLHPRRLPLLESMVESEQAQTLLTAIARSPHGFIIAGETESGKTTLMSIMLQLAAPESLVAVERAGELHVPESTRRFVPQWPVGDQPEVTFGDQIFAALQESPRNFVIDEIRSDEPQSIQPLLDGENAPRMMWVFRGSSDGKRLITALGMVARRSLPERSEDQVRALYQRLPFIITVRRRKGRLQLYSVAEWQFPEDAEYADYVELMAMGWEGIELTGKKAKHALDLPVDFWE